MLGMSVGGWFTEGEGADRDMCDKLSRVGMLDMSAGGSFKEGELSLGWDAPLVGGWLVQREGEGVDRVFLFFFVYQTS